MEFHDYSSMNMPRIKYNILYEARKNAIFQRSQSKSKKQEIMTSSNDITIIFKFVIPFTYL